MVNVIASPSPVNQVNTVEPVKSMIPTINHSLPEIVTPNPVHNIEPIKPIDDDVINSLVSPIPALPAPIRDVPKEEKKNLTPLTPEV